jgi:hypothetical protein
MSALSGINFPQRETPGARSSARHHNRKLASVVNLFTGNPTLQVGNPSILVRVQAKGLATDGEYQIWLESARSHDSRARTKVTGRMLRRAVIMLRGGCGVAEIERTLGTALRHWIALLPPELAA